MSVVRVAIVNDSAIVRAALRMGLESDPGIVVVGEAEDGNGALPLAKAVRPDVLLMDVVMPYDGYAATREVMRTHPLPILLVSGVVDARDVEVAMEALASGAVAVVELIPSPRDPSYLTRCHALCHLVRTVARTPTPFGIASPAPVVSVLATSAARKQGVIGIAASTGGPSVIVEVLHALRDADLPPILVVQHIASGFSEGFARWLGERAGRRCALATDGAQLEAGAILVAPEDRHLEVDAQRRVSLRTTAPVHRFRPSATQLLGSLGRVYGSGAVGVVLTGMGEDGAAGAKELRDAGGKLVVQNQASSVVFGMPRAALELAGADAVLAPRQMPAWIRSWLAAA